MHIPPPPPHYRSRYGHVSRRWANQEALFPRIFQSAHIGHSLATYRPQEKEEKSTVQVWSQTKMRQNRLEITL
jgi:hypothetical protein